MRECDIWEPLGLSVAPCAPERSAAVGRAPDRTQADENGPLGSPQDGLKHAKTREFAEILGNSHTAGPACRACQPSPFALLRRAFPPFDLEDRVSDILREISCGVRGDVASVEGVVVGGVDWDPNSPRALEVCDELLLVEWKLLILEGLHLRGSRGGESVDRNSRSRPLPDAPDERSPSIGCDGDDVLASPEPRGSEIGIGGEEVTGDPAVAMGNLDVVLIPALIGPRR